MKFIVALGFFSLLVQVSVARKCRVRPVNYPPSHAEDDMDIYASTTSNPIETSQPATAYPTPIPRSVQSAARAVANIYQITKQELDTAIPSRAGTNPCNGAQYPDECASNARAAAAINNALTQYKITNRGEAVAVIATMMFESDYWLYNINHYPGTPGQGTRNMQHINFNVEYASQLHPSAVKTAAGTGTITTQEENNVLALVLNDDDSFGSGFWLLVNQAPSYHNNPEKLRNNNSADFKDYVVNGIGVGIDWTDERYIPWATINKVFS